MLVTFLRAAFCSELLSCSNMSALCCRVGDFEYTRESIVFDLLGLQLYHGWLADPQNHAELAAVGQCTYNQLVEKIIEDKSSDDESKATEGACTRLSLLLSRSESRLHICHSLLLLILAMFYHVVVGCSTRG